MSSEFVYGDLIHGDKFNGNKYGGDHVVGDKHVHGGSTGPRGLSEPHPAAPDRRVILVLSANPSRTAVLRIDEERRAIDQAIALAQGNARLDIRSADALRVRDLQTALLRHRPAVVHFSGHGTGPEGILVTDDYGQPQPVSPRALAALFEILADSVRCVVLNACLTQEQAQAIAEHVPCVVGMTGRIADKAAILFATGFYQAIAFGRSVRVAYQLGRSMLDLSDYPDVEMPILVAGPGVAERTVIADGS